MSNQYPLGPPDEYFDTPEGARIHRIALVGFQPMRAAAFAKPIDENLPPPILALGVVIGPYAIVYAGAEIGEGTQICPYAHIREGVKIGKRCVIGAGVKIGYDTVIGDDCQLMDDTHISGGTIIGDRCFISVQVLAVNDDRPRGYQWKGVTPSRIGSDVVLGAGARLRPGVVIGDGATIAMGAVVTRDVPAGSTVKGIPARVDMPGGALLDGGSGGLAGVLSEAEFTAAMPRQVYLCRDDEGQHPTGPGSHTQRPSDPTSCVSMAIYL